MNTSSKRFRVALSFPGEKRDFIKQVANELVSVLGQEFVLYDDYITPELARPDLDLYLGQLYREQSELIVPFCCSDYERKKWCRLEWRQMRDILFNVEGHRIMPFRFDDTQISGVLSIDGYIKIEDKSPYDVAVLILQRLAHNEGKPRDFYLKAPPSSPLPLPPPTSGTRLPRQVVGRDGEIGRVVGKLCTLERVAVLGTGGVGKSTVLRAAFKREREVDEKFRSRRWAVECDGLSDPEALWGAMATTLRLESGGDLQTKVLDFLAQDRAALALDNFETPWDKQQRAAESVLDALLEVPDLALAIGMRSKTLPVGWVEGDAVRVGPLQQGFARQLFLIVAGEHLENDPHLDDLLVQLDGLPLALTLMAQRAQGSADLDDLWQQWNRDGVGAAQIGTEEHKDYALGKSFELSIHGPRMNDEARRLLSLLALLPDGVAHDDRDAIFPKRALDASTTLLGVQLAYEDEARRLRLLAPLREYVSRKYPPVAADLMPLHDHFLKLAKEGKNIGKDGGDTALKCLQIEVVNVEFVLHNMLDTDNWQLAVDAICEWGNFVRFSGYGTEELLQLATQKCDDKKELRAKADCLLVYAEVLTARFDLNGAVTKFEETRTLCEQIGYRLGEANALYNLGKIACQLSNANISLQRLEAAEKIYEERKNVLGRANCLLMRGEILIDAGDYEAAKPLIASSMSLYIEDSNLLGQANCVRLLGNIAYALGQREVALAKLQEAYILYEKIGNTQGMATCPLRLARIALIEGDYETSEEMTGCAIALFNQVSDWNGMGNSFFNLGDIAQLQGNIQNARQHYQRAISIFKKIGDSGPLAWGHMRFATISKGDEKQAHLCEARRIWLQIGREDWVQQFLVARFPDFDPNRCAEAEKGAP